MATEKEVNEARVFLEKWKNISNIVLSARGSCLPSRVNSILDQYASDPSLNILHPFINSWKGDNYFREAKFSQAIKEYNFVERELSGQTFIGVDIKFEAIRRKSACYERLGKPSRSSKVLLDAIKHYPLQECELRLAAAEVLERSKKIQDARTQYKDIKNISTKTIYSIYYKDIATRAIDRLKEKSLPYSRSAYELAQYIARCIYKKILVVWKSCLLKAIFQLAL